MKTLIKIILIISISLSVLVISIERNTYNKKYYLNSYEKYNIVKDTNRTMEDLEGITEQLINYLKDKGGVELLKPHYNEREILHMEDVKGLFNMARTIKYIGLLISGFTIIYFFKKGEYKFLQKTLTIGLFSNHIIFLLITMLAMTDFNKYFTYFHEIFFTNDLWLLDPRTDLLIQMLPEDFFITMAKKIGLSFFTYVAILQSIGYAIYKRGRGKNEKRLKTL